MHTYHMKAVFPRKYRFLIAWLRISIDHADRPHSWQTWEPFSVGNWILLMKKQKRMKAVEIASVDEPYSK